MAGTLSEQDVIDDLKRSLNDAAGPFNAAADADFRRHLDVALEAMQVKRPRTLLGNLTLVADQDCYTIAAVDFVQYKTHAWAGRRLQPWDPNYPGSTPRVRAMHDGAGWVLAFEPAPTYQHLCVHGSTFRFWYFARHRLAVDGAASTVAPSDRPLLLLRAQAEAMKELSMRNVNKPVQLRDGLTGSPRNSTPAALYQALLAQWEDAR